MYSVDRLKFAPFTGKCENKKPDKECERRAARFECDQIKTGVDMLTNCAKTCNSCWFNAGTSPNY